MFIGVRLYVFLAFGTVDLDMFLVAKLVEKPEKSSYEIAKVWNADALRNRCFLNVNKTAQLFLGPNCVDVQRV